MSANDLPRDGTLQDTTATVKLACDAIGTMRALWDGDRGTFWRSTEHRDRESSASKFFPTVSFSCAEALLQAYAKNPGWFSEGEACFLRDSLIPRLLEVDETEIDSTTLGTTPDGSGHVQPNEFTTARWVRAVALAGSSPLASSDQRRAAVTALAHPVGELLKRCALNPRPAGHESHPFLLFHTARALRSAEQLGVPATREMQTAISSCFTSARRAAESLLASHELGGLSASDAVALAFCAGVLAMSSDAADSNYVASTLRVCLNAQDLSGCWPLGRVIPENKDVNPSFLEIPTYQIASVANDALERLIETGAAAPADAFVHEALGALHRAAEYVERSQQRMCINGAPIRGWCSDRPYGKTMIESWTSAAVLEQQIASFALFEGLNRRAVLSTFRNSGLNGEHWPSWQRWDSMLKDSEPDSVGRILDYLDKRVVQPILSSPRALPSAADRTMSVLLFGPPGTSKTTIAQGVAQALGWPVAYLSPGVFIERGLEYIEAEARSVFDRLQTMSASVILFDECDELFRNREPFPQNEQTRGIAAFVTASMLPKLQDLHDKGRSVFFVCTNNFETLDPAMKRGGRIDHIIAVGPPDKEARLRIVTPILKRTGSPYASVCATTLAAATERFVRPELARACESLSQHATWTTEREAQAAATEMASKMEGSVMISKHAYERFKVLRSQFSHPHMEA